MKKSNIYLFNMIQSSRSHKDHIMGETSAPGMYYSLLIIGDSKVDGDGGEVDGDDGDGDGDGSGGTSPSRQGAETETSVPRNS
jgi:hypothetical protein